MSGAKDGEFGKDGLEVVSSNSSSHDAAGAPVPIEGTTHHLPTYEHEKALTWKFDLRILPMLAVMYLFNALDKYASPCTFSYKISQSTTEADFSLRHAEAI